MNDLLRGIKASLDREDFNNVERLCEEAMMLPNDQGKTFNVYLSHGIACFQLHQFGKSETSLLFALGVDSSNPQVQRIWKVFFSFFF